MSDNPKCLHLFIKGALLSRIKKSSMLYKLVVFCRLETFSAGFGFEIVFFHLQHIYGGGKRSISRLISTFQRDVLFII